MKVACKVTPEQKEFLYKTYRNLLGSDGSMYGKQNNQLGYPNVFLGHYDELNQTKREPTDYDAKYFFEWISYEEFKNKCMYLLIKKKKIKL